MDLLRSLARATAKIMLAALAGCGGGGGGGGGDIAPLPPAPPVELFGAWAGTWTGTNTPQGLVTGTWEAIKTAAGRRFVDLYYRYSPALAEYIRERDTLRAVARWSLWPAVAVIKHPLLAATMGMALVIALLIGAGIVRPVRIQCA